MRTFHYRIVHAGTTLTVWKTNEMNLSSFVHIEENCGDYETDAEGRAIRAAARRCVAAAERDIGHKLRWTDATDPRSSLVAWTGPEPVSA